MVFQPSEAEKEIAHRVAELGEKATIDNLPENPLSRHYREELLAEMISLGWEERKARAWIWKDIKYLYDREESVT